MKTLPPSSLLTTSTEPPSDYLYEARRARIVSGDEAEAAPEAEVTTSTEAAPEAKGEFDLSFLDLPEDDGDDTAETEVEATSQEGELTAEEQQFKAMMKKFLGVDVEDAIEAIREVQEFRRVQTVQKQLGDLQKRWGTDSAETERRLALVKARFDKYPPEIQKALDNVEGADLIYSKIAQVNEKKKGTRVPTLDRSSTKAPPIGTKTVTRAQLAALSAEEYAANEQQILALYAAGLVR